MNNSDNPFCRLYTVDNESFCKGLFTSRCYECAEIPQLYFYKGSMYFEFFENLRLKVGYPMFYPNVLTVDHSLTLPLFHEVTAEICDKNRQDV